MIETLDKKEVERFDIIANEWWNPKGKFKPLHTINPVRIFYIREQVLNYCEANGTSPKPLSGLQIADIGCGGGLTAEPLARLGATMTGVDPSPQSIAAAKRHASQSGLDIEYINGTTDELVSAERRFDCVLALEVIEHVPDLAAFLASCAQLLKPGGLVILSTLNRTAKSFALGIVAAEYVLRWLPRGTHDWSRFVTPAELRDALNDVELTAQGEQGLSFNPLGGSWHLNSDCGVNYFMTASKPAVQVVQEAPSSRLKAL